VSKWRNELALNARYGIAGVLNTLFGIGAIWGFTLIGLPPIVANLFGYAVALAFSFLNSKTFVFRSEGGFQVEGYKYLASFAVCYLINIATLSISVSLTSLNVMISQGLAVTAYVVSMYVASRLYVFR
jgi:putative flippase GtrA